MTAIHGPYSRSSTTLALLALADKLLALGDEVVFCPAGVPRLPVDPSWDRVIVADSKHAARHLTKSRIVVSTAPVQKAERVYLVPDCSSFLSYPQRDWANIKQVLCPSPPVRNAIKDYCQAGDVDTQVRAVRWDYNLPVFQNPYEINPDKLAFFWWAVRDGSGDLSTETQHVQAFNLLLKTFPQAYLTAYVPQNPAREFRDEVKKLALTYPARVEIMVESGSKPLESVLLAVSTHDLVVYTGLSAAFGLPVSVARHAGVPCLVYDHPVIASFVQNGVHGVLVPCELDFDPDSACASAVPDSGKFYSALAALAASPIEIEKLCKTCQDDLPEAKERFTRSTAALFDLV